MTLRAELWRARGFGRRGGATAATLRRLDGGAAAWRRRGGGGAAAAAEGGAAAAEEGGDVAVAAASEAAAAWRGKGAARRKKRAAAGDKDIKAGGDEPPVASLLQTEAHFLFSTLTPPHLIQVPRSAQLSNLPDRALTKVMFRICRANDETLHLKYPADSRFNEGLQKYFMV